ncbi:MAG: CDP-alcohol phosphatidyltransferase family protein [Chloroflexi bacterium]|nr:CDP-alcohol phosphatidyltransferase family protein [Chloroflexota bacterium]
MIDSTLRRAKDTVYRPFAREAGRYLSPLTITAAGGIVGLGAAVAGWQGSMVLGLLLWWANRALDGLDGSVARATGRQSVFGGYVDQLVDFAMYAVIPIGLTLRAPSLELFLALAFLLGTFYINAGAFLYLSSILEQRNSGARQRGDLTTVHMPRGIIEGFEAIVFYSLFFLFPGQLQTLFVVLGALVLVTAARHLVWASRNL